MPLTWNAVLLGTGSDNDTNESTLSTEGNFAGASVGSAAFPLSSRIHEFTVDDADGDGVWDRDNTPSTAETATITRDGTTETVGLDSVIVYNSRLTYSDGTTADITAVTFQLPDGRVFLAPEFEDNADSDALSAKPLQSIQLLSVNTNNTNLLADRTTGDFVPCLVAGTLVETPDGQRPVDDIEVGDLVTTLDHGPQPVRWVGNRTVPGYGRHAPILFKQGAYGAHADTKFSQQHQMLVSGPRVALLFGAYEVLAAAKGLIDDKAVLKSPQPEVTYVHLLFDQHEIIMANGMACESFNPGAYCVDAVAKSTREELLTLFPELENSDKPLLPAARPQLRVKEIRMIA